MYKGFNLEIKDNQWDFFSISNSFNYRDDFLGSQSEMNEDIENKLKSFRINEYKLDGTKMQSNWLRV